MPARGSGRLDPSSNIRVFGITSFLNDTASEMAYWILPAFLSSIGAGPAQLGVIEGIAESIASLAKLASGYVTDRVRRRKPIVVSGYVVANAVKPLLALTQAWWQVLLIRFADRFAKGVRGTARDVMVAESSDRVRLGSAYGLIQAMDSAGAIAGPLAALLLLRAYAIRNVFWFAAIPGLLCILMAALGIRETGTAKAQKDRVSPSPTRKPSNEETREREPGRATDLPARFYYVLVVVTLFSLGNSSDMFLVLRAQSIGIAVRYAPLLGLVFNVTYTVFSWPAGRVSDRLPRHWIAASGYLVFAIVYFLFAWAPSRPAIWMTMSFYGLFYALTNPVLKALVVDTVAPDVRGRALGVYFFATSVSALLASVITGELWKHFGASLPFYLSAAIAALSAVLLLGTKGDKARAVSA